MTKCKSCGAEIIWTTSPKGKAMPLDAKPEKRILLRERIDGHEPTAIICDTYVSHFATCPNAASHRSTKEK